MLLAGKSIVVTGGNSGIGESIVVAAAAEGANVVVDYVTHPEEATALIARVEAAGGRAVGVRADVSKAADLQAMIQAAVDTYGRLDVLINNAGIETRTSLLDTTEADFDKVVAVNMKSAFFGTQAAARQFILQGGDGLVINMSSVHEDWPMPGNIAYCVSKGGIRMLTRTAGVELGPRGIRVINVAPGAVSTPINASTESDPAKMRALDAAIPLGRMAEPAEIADVVVFLASGKAGYMTATTVVIDGGILQGSVGLCPPRSRSCSRTSITRRRLRTAQAFEPPDHAGCTRPATSRPTPHGPGGSHGRTSTLRRRDKNRSEEGPGVWLALERVAVRVRRHGRPARRRTVRHIPGLRTDEPGRPAPAVRVGPAAPDGTALRRHRKPGRAQPDRAHERCTPQPRGDYRVLDAGQGPSARRRRLRHCPAVRRTHRDRVPEARVGPTRPGAAPRCDAAEARAGRPRRRISRSGHDRQSCPDDPLHDVQRSQREMDPARELAPGGRAGVAWCALHGSEPQPCP